MGADGRTLEEIAGILGIPPHCGFGISSSYIPETEIVEAHENIKVGNKIYINETKKVQEDWLARIEKIFNFPIESVCLNQDSINSWVLQKTNIKDFMNDFELLDNIIVVSCVDYKNKWKYSFHENNTSPSNFHLSPNNIILVDMMYMHRRFRYADLPQYDARALEVPCSDPELSMLIILPNALDGLKSLRMPDIDLSGIESELSTQQVQLFLPPFEIEYQVKLKDTLRTIGCKEAFDQSTANFSKMSPSEVCISDIFHKVVIKVNEEGSIPAKVKTCKLRCLCRGSRFVSLLALVVHLYV